MHPFAKNGLAAVGVFSYRDSDWYTTWGYINQAGEMVIEPQFDSAHAFAKPSDKQVADVITGYAIVELDGKYGYINEIGNFIYEPVLDSARNFGENGLAIIEKDGCYGAINERFELVIPFTRSRIYRFFSDGYGAAKNEEGYYIIDEKGNNISGKYETILPHCFYF